MFSSVHHTIRGYVVGALWMPGAEAFKPFTYDLTREEQRWSAPGTLRDHVCDITNDGDFQSCDIAEGELVTTITVARGARVYTRTRVTPLERCASVADMVRTDWPGPIWAGDDDDDMGRRVGPKRV